MRSTKFDGSLHYDYATTLVADAPHERRVFLAPGTQMDSYRGSFLAKHPMLMLYWPDRAYNLHLSWFAEPGSDWRPRLYYVNIATPAIWDSREIGFIDLDLDVIWNRELDRVVVDDQDEFDENRARLAYPEALVRDSLAALAEVQALIAARRYPFDGSLEPWRPGR